MQIEIVGQGVDVGQELRERVRKRFDRVGNQVSPHSRLEIVLHEEANPSIADKYVAEATLRLKGTTLHAAERAPHMHGAVKALSLDIRRQVKRHREMRRRRARTRRLVGQMRGRAA